LSIYIFKYFDKITQTLRSIANVCVFSKAESTDADIARDVTCVAKDTENVTAGAVIADHGGYEVLKLPRLPSDGVEFCSLEQLDLHDVIGRLTTRVLHSAQRFVSVTLYWNVLIMHTWAGKFSIRQSGHLASSSQKNEELWRSELPSLWPASIEPTSPELPDARLSLYLLLSIF